MIEPVGVGEAEALAALHVRAFERPWSAAEIAKLLENPAAFALLAREGRALGFVLAWMVGGEAELLTVAVVPEARRQGVGAALVEAACAAARLAGAGMMHLEVGEDNLAARGLYEQLGYEQAGRRRGYYTGVNGPVDALLLRRALN